MLLEDTVDGSRQVKGTSGAAHTLEQGVIAGERNATSATNSYLAVHEQWNYTVVNVADDSTTVSSVPAILGRVYVDVVLSAHALPFKDAAVTVFNLPASTAAGTSFVGLVGTRFESSLIVDPNDAATGTVVVQWRPI